MNRRGFIQISSVAILPILVGVFSNFDKKTAKYTFKVQSNRKFGHLLRESATTKPTLEVSTDYIIVGGGIAGISAAHALKDENFLLFEGAPRLGGSSASESYKDVRFAMGAHYELAYPETYGTEVLQLLTELNVITYNSECELHEFVDKKYIINPEHAEQSFINNKIEADVLANAQGLEGFKKCLLPFYGKMPLPTRLIDTEFHYLNTLSFKAFLKSKFELSKDLEHRIDYQMLDDWGGKSDEVSALAGIHYYTCRPYNTKDVQLFSAPFGNSYFAEKMIGDLHNLQALQTNTLVKNITQTETGVEAQVVDTNGLVTLVKAKGLVYAGQKHALKYIFETEEPLFDNTYAPWVVLNIVCKKGVDFTKWQNDVLTKDLNFLGFVNSKNQHTRSKDFDTFTAYYCFTPDERKQLIEIENNPEVFIDATIALIEKETNTKFKDKVVHVNVNMMGHAMPIPKPNYLSLDSVPEYKNSIVFAGVDTGRLPLFFEACDSGLQAGKKIIENCNKPLNL